jgi:hypothetical protein
MRRERKLPRAQAMMACTGVAASNIGVSVEWHLLKAKAVGQAYRLPFQCCGIVEKASDTLALQQCV